MELKEAIERLKRILLQRDEINKIEDKEEREIEKSAYFEEMPFDEIDTVLKELNNRIPRKDIEDKINEFIEKPLLDIAETEKFKFEYTLDGLYAIKYGVIHILNELLEDKE